MTADGLSLKEWSDAEKNALAEEMALNYERMMVLTRDEVVGAMVECGCPRKDAEQQFANEQLSIYARQFYIDLQDSKLGDERAKERVERCKEAWGQMNKRREEQR